MGKLLFIATAIIGLVLVAGGPKKRPEKAPQPRQYAIEVTDEALESLRRFSNHQFSPMRDRRS